MMHNINYINISNEQTISINYFYIFKQSYKYIRL